MNIKPNKRRIWESEEGWEKESWSPSKRREEASSSLRPPYFPSSEASPSPTPSYSHSHSNSPLPSSFTPESAHIDNDIRHYAEEHRPIPPVGDDGMQWEPDRVAGNADSEAIIVCFGMLCEVNARLKDNAQLFEGAFGTHDASETTHRLIMVERDNHFALQQAPDVDIAVLNSKIVKSMLALSHLEKIRYDVFAAGNKLSEAISAWARKGKREDFHVEIVIYGPQLYRDELGSILSASDWYLQPPRYTSPGIRYDNPHFWDLGLSIEPAQVQYSSNESPKAKIMAEAAVILNTLDQTSVPAPATIDSKLMQSLLSHQKTGVNFIAQREGWQRSSPLSLWDSRQRASMHFYEHRITGTRSSIEPQETVGGILADEMGLGKTLTLLTAVVGTLDHARSWANTHNTLKVASGLPMPSIGATLVVVPSVLMIEQWRKEIKRHDCISSLRVLKYHGSNRANDGESLSNYDVVLSTYGTVSSEFATGESQLYQAQWFRVVLDEAHNIRDHTTRQFRAMSALPGHFRWCLTGTPIQNSLGDLGSLVRFLRVPFLDTNVNFRDHILRPAEAGKAIGFANLRILLQSICLRRTKEILKLDEPKLVSQKINLSPEEISACARIIEDTRITVEKAVSEGKANDARRIIFKVILKLRLLCTYGTFYRPWENLELDANTHEVQFAFLQQSNDANCYMCSCDITSIDDSSHPAFGAFTGCLHLLCADCYDRYNQDIAKACDSTSKKPKNKRLCPICGESVLTKAKKKRAKGEPIEMELDSADNGYSTKLVAVLANITQHYQDDKIIVFSSWKRPLEILSSLLNRQNIPCLQIDGSLSTKRREDILANFHRPHNNVLLMTLGTGGVGLNLTVANRVHIIEPQWNPTVETQAIGRVMRIGQKKQVYVTRYIVKNSIEEYVQNKQSRKLTMAAVGWNTENKGMQKALELWSVLGQTDGHD